LRKEGLGFEHHLHVEEREGWREPGSTWAGESLALKENKVPPAGSVRDEKGGCGWGRTTQEVRGYGHLERNSSCGAERLSDRY